MLALAELSAFSSKLLGLAELPAVSSQLLGSGLVCLFLFLTL